MLSLTLQYICLLLFFDYKIYSEIIRSSFYIAKEVKISKRGRILSYHSIQ